MAFTHSAGSKHDAHHLPPHPHDTVAEARACVEQWAADIEAEMDARAEYEMEMRHERWLEDGGEQSGIIAAEDALEREREANDPFLQALRRGREMSE